MRIFSWKATTLQKFMLVETFIVWVSLLLLLNWLAHYFEKKQLYCSCVWKCSYFMFCDTSIQMLSRQTNIVTNCTGKIDLSVVQKNSDDRLRLPAEGRKRLLSIKQFIQQQIWWAEIVKQPWHVKASLWVWKVLFLFVSVESYYSILFYHSIIVLIFFFALFCICCIR